MWFCVYHSQRDSLTSNTIFCPACILETPANLKELLIPNLIRINNENKLKLPV